MVELENKDVCKKCGGKCCKKCGCDYYIEDFENFKINYLEKRLREGNMSIVATISFSVVKGKCVAKPFLYLRARNKGRDIVDLLSLKKKCSLLTESGCMYDFNNRPSGGKYLVPRKDEDEDCLSSVNMQEKIFEYKPYQDVLAKLVKRFTNKTVGDKLREDAAIFFYDMFTRNFEDVSPRELEEVQNEFLYLLAKAFPDEVQIAHEKILEENRRNNILLYKRRGK